MKMNIKLYDKCKYEEDSKVIASVDLSGVASLDVREIPASEILKHTDGSCVDDYNKYTILTFENGDTSTYRHCYVDVFRID